MKGEDTRGRPTRPAFETLEPRLLLNGTIEGQVWEDLNGDGLRDAGELGLNGWTVELVDVASGAVVDTQTTADVDLDGNGTIDPTIEGGVYSFAAVADGRYDVRLVLADGWDQSSPMTGPIGLELLQEVNRFWGGGGVSNPGSIVTSADGKHAYWLDEYYRILIYDRDATTGELAYMTYQYFSDHRAERLVGSPDGRQLYGLNNGADELVVFERDVDTGALTIVQAVASAPWDETAFSQDGSSLYTWEGSWRNPKSVDLFARDAVTGWLTHIVTYGTTDLGGASSDLIHDVAISPSGEHAYVSFGSTLSLLSRNVSTGELSVVATMPITGMGDLTEVAHVLVSPDGLNVYATGDTNDFVATFDRDPVAGTLTFVELTYDPLPDRISGSDWLSDVQMSPDGRSLYLAGANDNRVGVFSRDPETGKLTYYQSEDVEWPIYLAVAADGLNLYAVSNDDRSVAVFGRVESPGGHRLTVAGDTVAAPPIGVYDFTGRIAGVVFEDLDGDGIHDADEPGLDGWVVELMDSNSGAVVASQVTAGDDVDGDGSIDPITETGLYDFARTLPGSYEIRQTSPTGWTQTVPLEISGQMQQVQYLEDGFPGIDGLSAIKSSAMSPDGSYVYVPAQNDNALVVFRRDPFSGELTQRQFIQEVADGTSMSNPIAVAVSADGAFVYLIAGRTLAVFQVDQVTGHLSPFQTLVGDYDSDNGLYDGPSLVTVSPDGDQIYVGASWELAVFDRDPVTDMLSLNQLLSEGVGGIPALKSPRDIVFSPDGTSVYAVCDEGNMNGSVVVFERDTASGQLSFAQYVKYGVDGVDGLYDPKGGAVSPDGEHVYVTSMYGGGMLTLFDRDLDSGELTYVRTYHEDDPGWEGLPNNWPLLISQNGHYVVVGGNSQGENTLSIFRRNTSTGELTRLNGYGYTSLGFDGLNSIRYLLLSPDQQHLYVMTTNSITALAVGHGPVMRVDLDDSEEIVGVAIGKAELIPEIAGRVFDDADGDGLVDTGEAGLNRWTVQLVGANTGEVTATTTAAVDLDGNGTISAEEQGVFSFANVLPGDYVLRAVVEDGYTPTAPAGAELPLALRSGDSSVTDVLFAMDLTNPAEIGGVVFQDVNADGLQGADEPGLNGWTVELVDPVSHDVITTVLSTGVDVNGDGTIDPVTETGSYSFAGLPPREYIVRAQLQADQVQIAPAVTTGGLVFRNRLRDTSDPAEAPHGFEVRDTAISADGQFLYVSTRLSGSDNEINVFRRDPDTGDLTFVQSFIDITGNSRRLVIGPDANHLYGVASGNLTVFDRNVATGELSVSENYNYRGNELAFSPDGLSAYLTIDSDELVIFSRDPVSGALTELRTVTNDADSGFALSDASDVTVSNDGRNVYVASTGETDDGLGAVAVFDRDPATGDLTFSQGLYHDSDGDNDYLLSPTWISVSPDDRTVYTVNKHSDRLTAYRRHAITGRLELAQATVIPTEYYTTHPYVVDAVSSPDSDFLYHYSYYTEELHVYRRDARTSELTFVEALDDPKRIHGFQDGVGLTISPDGRNLYIGDWTRLSIHQISHADDVYRLTLAPDELASGQNFAYQQTLGVVSGTVFHDHNKNASRDTADEGLDGWVVDVVDPATGVVLATGATFSNDADGNGTIDPLTESGLYEIGGLVSGDYEVRLVPSSGWLQTSPADPLVYSISVDQDLTPGLVFAAYQPAFISGQAFEDANSNGVLDGDETGRDGWLIELVDLDTGLVAETTTTQSVDLDEDGAIDPAAETGLYFFTALLPGNYEVRQSQPNWQQTLPATGGYVIALNAGDNIVDVDFGNLGLHADVFGQAWNDVDGDGVHDPDEPGLDGVTMELLSQSDQSLVATTVTASVDLDGDGIIDHATESGLYSFIDIPQGDYIVQQVLPTGWWSVDPFHPGVGVAYLPLLLASRHTLAVDMDAAGNSVVLWSGGNSVSIQRIASDGTAVGGPSTISDEPIRSDAVLAIAVNSSGQFVTTWYVGNTGIMGRLFAADGTPLTDYFLATTEDFKQPGVAISDSGTSVIVWYEGNDVLARLFNADGTPMGDAFVVQADTGMDNDTWQTTKVAMAADGSFTVVWVGVGAEEWIDVFARQFDAAGNPIADAFYVTDEGDARYSNRRPDIAMTSDGRFVVAWEGRYQEICDYLSAYAKVFNADGSVLVEQFHAPSRPLINTRSISVSLNELGQIALAWHRTYDWNVEHLSVALFEADGTPFGTETAISEYNSDGPTDVALSDTGRLVAVAQNKTGFGPGLNHIEIVAAEGFSHQPYGHYITLADGDILTGVDLGAGAYGALAGQVFHDADLSGVMDGSEVGLDGWTVELVDSSTGAVLTTTTSASVDVDGDGTIDPLTEQGLYEFTDVPPGDYEIRQTTPAGWQQVAPLYDTGQLGNVQTFTDLPPMGAAVAAAVDGEVYASADGALYVLSHDAATGELTILQTLTQGIAGVDGLDYVKAIKPSADGLYVYVTAQDSQSISTFSRDPATGLLSHVQTWRGTDDGYEDLFTSGAMDMVFSADGRHLYAICTYSIPGSTYDLPMIVSFERDAATGLLSLVDVDTLYGYRRGFQDIVISSDGKHVYVTYSDGHYDNIEIYSRDAVTGALTDQGRYNDSNYDQIGSLQISGDGQFLYAMVEDEDYPSIMVWQRDDTTGEISLVQSFRPMMDGDIVSLRHGDMALSPDGETLFVLGFVDGTILAYGRSAGDGYLTPIAATRKSHDGTDLQLNQGQISISADGKLLFARSRENDQSIIASYAIATAVTNIDVSLAPGADLVGLNLGNALANTVSGQLYSDANLNAAHDAGEIGVNGWTVELVDAATGVVVESALTGEVDLNGDGVIDPETEAGLYELITLLVGDFEVRLVVSGTWGLTAPAGMVWPITFSGGEVLTGNDFGAADLPSISGQVFYDSGGDGLHDGDENGLNSWTVELVDPATSNVLAAAITADRDIDGNGTIDPIEEQGTYRFTGLLPGTYLVRQVAQNAWVQTAPVTTTYTYTVDVAQHETEGDFGNYQPSTVLGQKWHDVDADGVRDDGEVGLSGWTIELVDAATGLVVATTVTADMDLNTDGAIDPMTEAGLYSFIDLPAGDYELREVQQTGWVQSWLDPLDVRLRVSLNGSFLYDLETFTYYPYWLEGSHTDFNRDPGLWKVNDDVFNDPAFDRWNMPQYTPGTDPNTYWFIVENVRTGENYWQTGSDDDFDDFDIKVVEDPGSGVIEMTGYHGSTSYTFALIDLDGTVHAEVGGQIGPILIDTFPIYGAHAWTFGLANDLSIGGLDFSNFQGGGEVTGRHFNDLNANGVRDDGEVGLDGWTVEGVDPVSGRVVGSAITASEDLDGDGLIDPATEMGLYSLASMPVGTFDIRLVVLEGWAQTVPFGDTHTVTFAAGEAQSGFDFAAAELGMVSGQVFNDLDSSGVQETGEFGINGWTVELIDTDTGLVIAATTSGGVDVNGDGTMDPLTEAGRYTFSGLSAGNYETRLISPSGWTQTSPMADPFTRLFAADASGGVMTIHEIDPTDGSTLNSFAGPANPVNVGYQGLAAGPDSLFYVDANNFLTPTLWELDLDTGAVIDSDPLTFGTIYVIKGLAYLDGLLYIQYMPDQVAVWDPASDSFVQTLTISAAVTGSLTGASDLGVLFDSNAAGEIIAIDPTDGSVLNTFATGLGALDGGLAYVGGELLAIGSGLGSLVHRIDPATGAVLGSFALDVTGSIVGLGGDYESPAAPAWRRIALAADEHTEGADYGYHSSNVRGDMDGDGDVDADDIDLLFGDFGDPGRAGPQSDLDGDGDADVNDMDILVRNLVETTIGVGSEYGDANLDGLVDATDLAILKVNYASSGVGWSGSDFNGSGLVNLTDLAILATYFGFDASAAAPAMAPPAASQPPAAPVQVTAAATLASDVAATPIATSASLTLALTLAPQPDVTDTLSTSAPVASLAADPADEPMGVYESTTHPNRRRRKRAGKRPRQSQPRPPVAARALQLSEGRDNGRKKTAPLPAQGAIATTAPTPRSTRRRRGDDHLEDEFSILQIDALMKVNV